MAVAVDHLRSLSTKRKGIAVALEVLRDRNDILILTVANTDPDLEVAICRAVERLWLYAVISIVLELR